LKRFLPAYDKARLRFSDFAAGVDDAVARAERLEPTGSNHTTNPSTSMWRLINTIRGTTDGDRTANE
jgi:hypothetical protein